MMQAPEPQPGMSTADTLRAMGVKDPNRRRFSYEVAGEILLLLLVGAFFLYLFVESLSWTLGAALMPRIAVIIGTPFWLYRLIFLLRRAKSSPAEIMDIGFRVGADPAAEAQRFARIVLYVVALYVGIWLFGFHLALPVGTFLYLFFYGKAGWGWSLGIALAFLVLIIAVYDSALRVHWHDPLIFDLRTLYER